MFSYSVVFRIKKETGNQNLLDCEIGQSFQMQQLYSGRKTGIRWFLIDEHKEIWNIDMIADFKRHKMAVWLHGQNKQQKQFTHSMKKLMAITKELFKQDFVITPEIKGIFRYILNHPAKNDTFSWSSISREVWKEKCKTLEEENNFLCEEYEIQIDDLKEEMEILNMTIYEQEEQMKKLQKSCSHSSKKGGKGLLNYGEEREFYEGEILEMIIETLQKQLAITKTDSRRAHIIEDIIKCNPIEGKQKKRKKEIKQILNGYTIATKHLQQQLRKYGFEVEKGGDHYKLRYFGDERYYTTLAGSSSDAYRAGKNLAGEIITNML